MIILQRIGGSAGEAISGVEIQPAIINFSFYAVSKQSRVVLVDACCAVVAGGVALETAGGAGL